jgi:hypothetical protein
MMQYEDHSNTADCAVGDSSSAETLKCLVVDGGMSRF